MLQFRSGALGEVNACWSLAIDVGMRNTIEPLRQQGHSVCRTDVQGAQGGSLHYVAGAGAEWLGEPPHSPAATEPHDYKSWPPHVHHYKREIASFVHRYLQGLQPYGPTGEDGRAVVEVILGGYESARTGKVVNLP